MLAAGASRRLGRPKQLVPLAGEALVRRTTRMALQLRPAWIGAVVGARRTRVVRALAGLPVQVVTAHRWRDGMAASLVAGVRALPPGPRHVLVLSSDQWRLQARDLHRLVRARGRVPAAAAYASRAGIPALLPLALRRALLALRGDRGARALLGDDVVAVPMARAAADLDTPEALTALRRAERGPRCAR